LQAAALGPPTIPTPATSLANLGAFCSRSGASSTPPNRYFCARRWGSAARYFGEHHPQYATALTNLALPCLCDRGQLDGRRTVFFAPGAGDPSRGARRVSPPTTPRAWVAWRSYSRSGGELDAGRTATFCAQALEIRRAVFWRAPSRSTRTALSNLALLPSCDRSELDARPSPCLRQALEIRRRGCSASTTPDSTASQNALELLLHERQKPRRRPGPRRLRCARSSKGGSRTLREPIGAALRRAATLMETGGFPPGDRLPARRGRLRATQSARFGAPRVIRPGRIGRASPPRDARGRPQPPWPRRAARSHDPGGGGAVEIETGALRLSYHSSPVGRLTRARGKLTSLRRGRLTIRSPDLEN